MAVIDGLFLKPTDERLLAYIDNNYDQQQLAALIFDVQEYRILPLLGSGLYATIKAEIEANTVSVLNTTVLTKLRPAHRFEVLANGLHVFNYKIRDKGVQTMSSDNSASVDLSILDRMPQQFSDQAQEFAQRLTNYLAQNQQLYPTYYNPPTPGIDTIYPKASSYETGWYTGNRYSKLSPDEKERFPPTKIVP